MISPILINCRYYNNLNTGDKFFYKKRLISILNIKDVYSCENDESLTIIELDNFDCYGDSPDTVYVKESIEDIRKKILDVSQSINI